MKLLELFDAINPYEKKIYQPYIIAEIGVNHEGSMKLAKRLVDEAKNGGADAVKFQSYKAETLTSKILLPTGILQKSLQPANTNYLKNMIVFG